jgi:hypothetical protein
MEQPMSQHKMQSIAKKVLDSIEGEPFDDLVPAITLVLADIGVSSGVSADVFIAFVSKSIRGVFIMKEDHDASLH